MSPRSFHSSAAVLSQSRRPEFPHCASAAGSSRSIGELPRSAVEPDRCQPQTVLIIDEHELSLAGMQALLTNERWVERCLVASTRDVAAQVLRRTAPQLVLISTSLGGRPTVDLCREFKALVPHARIVLMCDEGTVSAAVGMRYGACAALSKHMRAGVIVSLLARVAEGARLFPRASSASTKQLSARERDVLTHVVSGLSNPEVAAALNLSRHTVKQHTSAVYRKLGVRNRAEAASRARELGLVA